MMLLNLGNLLRGRLVVDVDQLNTLEVELIEKEATLIESLIRETGCEGVWVCWLIINI